jgi:hypothetical protein
MKVYLSSRYARMDELKSYRDQLLAAGHECTSRWLDGGTFENNAANAQIDVADVLAADVLVNFTDEAVEHSPHPYAARGGRHVEFGLALGIGLHLVIVGPRENVFHWHPHVTVCEDFADAMQWLADMKGLLEDAVEVLA